MNGNKEELKDELRHLANEVFPKRAKEGEDYPVYLNHCFLRIVYDNLFQQQWQKVLDNKKPAIHQLDEDQLCEAIAIGHEIIEDPEQCQILNQRSLTWRGKQGPNRKRK